MRRTVIGAVGAVTLALTALPGVAVGATRVDGDHFQAAGLRLAVRDCVDPGAAPGKQPTFRVVRNKPNSGKASIAWQPRGTGTAVGATAYAGRPTQLSRFSIRLRTTAAQSQGIASVRYEAPDDDGYWIGTSDLITDLNPDDKPNWRTIDGSALTYSWRHYTPAGVEDATSFPLDLPSFAALRGGDGKGARIGFLFGCDGNPFQVDKLVVRSGGPLKDYEFEGIRTKASLQRGSSGKKTVRVTYGEKVNLVAKVREVIDNDGVPGKITIAAKGPGDKKFRKVVSKKVGTSGALRRTVQPARNTTYRVTFPGSTKHDKSSAKLKVLVRKNVTGTLAQRSVRQGSRLTMRGRALPANRVAIQLQKYSGGKWRTISRGSTAGNGRYAISAATNRVGKSFWRVRVAGGPGNIWGASVARKLTTVAPPSGGGGG
ncbi:hypothetical protein G6553_19935, partial [Nocardioides sp. IC4_145]|uniref:hypothetical protein n=1 Tax=Nocardioides sp. IC4_145 TaxID=2714037 RepID=UPI00140B14E8